MKQQGSALIVAMMIITGISTAAFGLARIFLADVRISSAIEDSTLSYYVAEAAVEEGLLRYRVDRNDSTLNEHSRISSNKAYSITTSFLATSRLSTWISGNNTTDTIVDAGALDESGGGAVKQNETVEIATPSTTGQVDLRWRWLGGVGPATGPDLQCGVETTSLNRDGSVIDKNIALGNADNTSVSQAGGRAAIRIKPLCRDLEWLAWGAVQPVGRTVQTIDGQATIGRAKRKLTAILDRTSGSIVGFFDYIIGSEGDLIKP